MLFCFEKSLTLLLSHIFVVSKILGQISKLKVVVQIVLTKFEKNSKQNEKKNNFAENLKTMLGLCWQTCIQAILFHVILSYTITNVLLGNILNFKKYL